MVNLACEGFCSLEGGGSRGRGGQWVRTRPEDGGWGCGPPLGAK